MDKTTISVAAMRKSQIVALGKQLENNYRQIVFDCRGFGEGVTGVTLVHQRSEDVAPYIVGTTNSNIYTWVVSDTDTAFFGYGKGEVRVSFSNGLAKSITFPTLTIKSITADTTIPSALQSWYDAMIDYIDENSITLEELDQAIADYLEQHPIDFPVQSVNGKTGAVVLTASDVSALPDDTVIPTKVSQLQNDSGFLTGETDPVFAASPAKGIQASDITNWNGKYTKPSGGVPVSDLNSTAQSRLMPTGGSTGQVLTKKSGSNYDLQWTTPSGGGGAVDSVNGKTGAVVLDAEDVGALSDQTVIPTKTSDLTNDSGFGTYSKPSGGIPKSDLASDVQTSLGKADTALQSAPVTSVNGQTGDVTVTDTNTTYTISISGNVITLTPSTGTAQTITPSNATTSVAGYMSATDKSHLDDVYADYSSALTALGVS